MSSQTVLDLILNVSEVVFRTYFNYIRDISLREDLLQEGYKKAYELIKEGDYDPDKNLWNYLYTGARNAMSNYMYHIKKDMHTSYDLYNDNILVEGLNEENCQLMYNDVVYQLNMDEVVRVCFKYSIYGNYMGLVLDYFREVGLSVPDYSCVGPSVVNQSILNSIIVNIIYNI